MPLYGSPMLSMIVTSSLGGISRRMSYLHAIAKRRRVFDPRAGRRAQVQLELAAVDAGEKILAHKRKQRERKHARRRETRR